ncbi:MAG TPA: enolase C-terminal domain-like protein [Spirochaetia bacterium]|nr:enolase C-terminal domain-like protein [Spirochaetia bacterium]
MILRELTGREILDSRGRPTVEASCVTETGAHATVSVPSGRSTGSSEAYELRDGDPRRYSGLGCLRAAGNITGEISKALTGIGIDSQGELDDRLIKLDGTPNKSRLGANALLAVSLVWARAHAEEEGLPLYGSFGSLIGSADVPELPRLTINLFSGGKHAGKQVAIQDVLIVPLSPQSVDGSLVMMYDVYRKASEIIFDRFGMRLLTADEGGLAPPFERTEAMLETAVEAIEAAGYRSGVDAALAVDVASTHFFEDGRYHIDGSALTPSEMIDTVEEWVDSFPLLSVEDALSENDWDNWPRLRQRIGGRVLVLGDDLLCTNPGLIARAVGSGCCNALLLKVNQVGTLTEAARALELARDARWQVTVSVRSGETEDSWAADLAVGWRGDQFKNGSITQSERLAKYNRLLKIEMETGRAVRPWRGPAAL